MNTLQPVYENSLLLKAATFKDVLELAKKKYVGENDMWFYNWHQTIQKIKKVNLTIISPCKILFHFLSTILSFKTLFTFLLIICITINSFKLYRVLFFLLWHKNEAVPIYKCIIYWK
jgi:hypothetical protein